MDIIYIENITISVVFLYLFFGVLLFTYQKGNRLSKYLLGTYFICLGLIILDVFFQKTEFYHANINFAFLLNTLPFLLGPLLLFLSKSATNQIDKIKKIEFLHFAPYLLSVSFFLVFFHLKDYEFKQVFYREAIYNSNSSSLFSSIILFVILSVYVFQSYKYLERYRKQIKEQLSNVSTVNLEWLNYILKGSILIFLMILMIQTIYRIYGIDFYGLNILLLILLFVLLAFILITIVKGVKSEDIFLKPIAEEQLESKEKEAQVDLQQLQHIEEFMTTNQPYLNPSIKLKELADQLNMTPRDLSKIINLGRKQSFFDFINSYRIEFAKTKIAETTEEKLTFLEVMYASGFNSKSSFNTSFKKHSGYTPTEWKKLNS